MKKLIFPFLLIFAIAAAAQVRTTIPLKKEWKFSQEDNSKAFENKFNDNNWETVEVPHDWAIKSHFDPTIDAQTVMVVADGESVPSLRTGRTGGLPFIGVGWYRKTINLPKSLDSKRLYIDFDGAMSHAKVYFNGKYIGEQPYGYSPFGFDLTDNAIAGGENIIAVRLENEGESSRWYPGAGIYRDVNLVITENVHVKKWGTYITTPKISKDKAEIEIVTDVINFKKAINISITTNIIDPKGKVVAKASTDNIEFNGEHKFKQTIELNNPKLWDLKNPDRYVANTKVYADGKLTDSYNTCFGIRSILFDKDKGFFLNGERVQMNGVCIHHDLGSIGAAVNRRATERQIEILQSAGSNAIRTSHNPASRTLIELCDSMGMLVIEEAFDEWKNKKTENGYSKDFDKWADSDVSAMIRRDKNSPSIVLWSIGNEVREQINKSQGANVAKYLVSICKREDPSRLTTAGFDQHIAAINNGLAAAVDVVGFNYKPQDYKRLKLKNPDMILYGSETSSTVSSRGNYVYPWIDREKKAIESTHENAQACSYDMESPKWATSPDTEFAEQDDNKFLFGEFVWTGFDYLGEPTPYNDNFPSRSSYFGMVDMAGIPKDRFYLYQSHWSKTPMLHLLPHWNHKGREGKITPVFCYTNYPKAELFVNGISQGVLEKDSSDKYKRYRLMWKDVVYQPGEIKVVAYNNNGEAQEEKIIKTAGAPAKIVLNADRNKLKKGVSDLSYVTVSLIDKDGNLCPESNNKITFSIEGAGYLRGLCNGDATSHISFSAKSMPLFNGMLVATIAAEDKTGKIKLTALSEGLPSTTINLTIR